MLAAVGMMFVFTALVGVLLFGAAGRLDVPMFWAYLAVYLAVGLVNNVLLVRRNPELFRLRTTGLGPSDVPDQLYRYALGFGYIGQHTRRTIADKAKHCQR